VVSGSQESQFFPAYQVKQSAKWINWVGTTGPGLTKTHFFSLGQTLTANHYINKILNKEAKPLLSR